MIILKAIQEKKKHAHVSYFNQTSNTQEFFI